VGSRITTWTASPLGAAITSTSCSDTGTSAPRRSTPTASTGARGDGAQPTGCSCDGPQPSRVSPRGRWPDILRAFAVYSRPLARGRSTMRRKVGRRQGEVGLVHRDIRTTQLDNAAQDTEPPRTGSAGIERMTE
jgi:hypothetical protein